jgi:RNA polymerase sigma-70 factor, ECF subfamily
MAEAAIGGPVRAAPCRLGDAETRRNAHKRQQSDVGLKFLSCQSHLSRVEFARELSARRAGKSGTIGRELTGGMIETSRATLRHLLLGGYDDLKRRLACRLGSMDLAGEALQETFLRLECAGDIGPVRQPRAYLYRIALNIAINRRVAENRRLTAAEAEALLDVVDETPDPARTAEARSEVEALKRALVELPPRRREIFLAAWVYEVPHQKIAERFGITLRTVQMELKDAREHCALRLDRNVTKKLAATSRQLSLD